MNRIHRSIAVLTLAAGFPSAALAQEPAPSPGATPPASSPRAESDMTVAGPWRIDQAMREPLIDRRLARIDFGTDGRLTGHTSCNSFSATYKLLGDAITITPPIATQVACSGEMQSEQQDRVLTALSKATSARVRPDGLLELRNADGMGVLRGTRFPP